MKLFEKTRKQFVLFVYEYICQKATNITEREVKMTKFFLRVYGPRRSRGLLTGKKRTRPISRHPDRKSLVNKDIFCGYTAVYHCRSP